MENTTWLRQLAGGRGELGRLLTSGFDTDDAAAWFADIEHSLSEVSSALSGFDLAVGSGYYDDVVVQAPRLVPAIEHLRQAHQDLRAAVEVERARIQASEPDEAVVDLRRGLDDVVVRIDLCTHRQITLMYEAYDVDIGGPGA